MAYEQITESLNVNIVAIVMPVSWHSQRESMRHLLHQHPSLKTQYIKMISPIAKIGSLPSLQVCLITRFSSEREQSCLSLDLSLHPLSE